MKRGRIFAPLIPALTMACWGFAAQGQVMAEMGKEANLVLLPKFIGILVFDQANDGAMEAHDLIHSTSDLLHSDQLSQLE